MFDSLKRVIVFMDPKRTLFLGLFYLNSKNKKISKFSTKNVDYPKKLRFVSFLNPWFLVQKV